MEIGASIPYLDPTLDPPALRDFAQAVEGLGYAYVASGDHILGEDPATFTGHRGPYTVDYRWYDPFTLFAFLACATTRLGFLSSVLVLPLRQTALVAKQAAQLDFLCGGRLRLGVGIGWNQPEYEALNERFSTRGSRMEEQFAVLRALWTQPVVTFRGRWHTIAGLGLNPRPIQQPIPLWIGGSAEAVLKRTGRLADGWIAHWNPLVGLPQTPENVREPLARIRAYAAEAGRDPRSLSIQGSMSITADTASDWGQTVDEWRQLGATHLTVATQAAPTATRIDLLRTFAAEVGLAYQEVDARS